ncbi:MAG: hypothetical protein CFE43_11965 [Burkholderiales bacterium PBB3]|nr:MAG: hypothetical protein CFE43_11965 [Burkholderiales bacterium PBB3]
MRLKIIDEPFGQGLKTLQAIAKDAIAIELKGKWVEAPSKYTLQLGVDKHLEPSDQLWAMINHSCDPNLWVDAQSLAMVAKRDIAAGEALTFNYLTTEWDMAEPFSCQCGTKHCFGNISGARYLEIPQRNECSSWIFGNAQAALEELK